MSAARKRLLPYVHGRKWGYLTTDGDVFRQASYDYTAEIDHGVGFVIENDVLTIVNDGLHILGIAQECPVSSYSRFCEGLLSISNTDTDKSFYIDIKGHKQFGQEFDNALSFSRGRAFVKLGEKWGMLDNRGRWIVEPVFHGAISFQDNSDVTSVCLNSEGHCILLDRHGKTVSDKFDWLGCVSEGLVPFGKEISGRMRFGVANEMGEEIIPAIYCECDDGFRNGLLGVEIEDGTWGVIDRSGRWVIHPKYSYIGECRDGLMLAYQGGERTLDRHLKDGKFGFVDTADRVKIDFQFDEAFPFCDGIALVNWYVDADSENYDTLMGYVSIHGRVVWREQQTNSQ